MREMDYKNEKKLPKKIKQKSIKITNPWLNCLSIRAMIAARSTSPPNMMQIYFVFKNFFKKCALGYFFFISKSESLS